MNRIAQLSELGQSIWLDFIERGMLQSGELVELVDAGVRGVTSNPTIFQQAIDQPGLRRSWKRSPPATKDAKGHLRRTRRGRHQAAADVCSPYTKPGTAATGLSASRWRPTWPTTCRPPSPEAHQAPRRGRPSQRDDQSARHKTGHQAIRRLISDGINVNVTSSSP